MNENLRKKLSDKGWEEEHIEKAMDVFEDADTKRDKIIQKLDKIVYWIALLIAIVGNFVISIILIPFLISISNKIALGIIIFAISLSFGFLYNILLKDIEELDHNNRFIAGLIIPSLGLINILIITNVSNHFLKLLKIQTPHNPFIIGFVYLVGFIIPYASDKFFQNKSINIIKSQTKD